METRAFRLRLTAPLHVGEQGIGFEESQTYIPSDTLFGALVVTWAEMPAIQDRLADLFAAYADDPPLLVTSAFPYIREILLLPMPALGSAPSGSGDAADRKQFKRVRWISEGVFSALIAAPGQKTLDDLWGRRSLVQGGAVWMHADEADQIAELLQQTDGRLWSNLRVPKVTVDRIGSASALYHVGKVHFAEGCGLWCAVRGSAPWPEYVEAALTLLQDSGIGGQRSRGNGRFALETMDPPAFLSEASGDYAVMLSRTAPTVDEMTLLKAPGAAYQLVSIGGFNGTPSDAPIVRRQVRMLAEGAVIGFSGRAPGQLVDVKPEQVDQIAHPIYRFGYGFPVGLSAGPMLGEEGAA